MITVTSPFEDALKVSTRKEWKPTKKQERFIQVPFDIDEAGYGGALGAGKDICVNTLIFTTDGFKYLLDVHPGDTVFNNYGLPVSVIAESEIFEDHKCYELTFDSGEKIIAGEDHEWWVFTHKSRQEIFKRTEKYRAKRRESRPARGRLPLYRFKNRKKNLLKPPTGELIRTKDLVGGINPESIKVYNSYVGEVANLPLHPYVFGCWLGDGSSSDSRYTCGDSEILDRFVSLGYNLSSYEPQYSYRILGISSILRSLNVLNNKHIPKEYFMSHELQREELLQGIMDTDGHIISNGQCELTLTNKRLSDDTLTLIHSLGIKASRSTGRATLYGKDCGEKYVIHFSTTRDVFKLSRKLEKVKLVTRKTQDWHYIKEIKEVPTVKTKCIQVEGGIYVISKSFIPTHNSDVLMLLPLIYGFHEYPKYKGLFLRRTFPELEGEIIPRSREFFPSTGATYNVAKHRWEFPRGGMDIFGHMKDEKDVKKYDTLQAALIRWDESTSFTGFQYEYLTLRRNRSPVGFPFPPFTRWGSNPGNVGHSYFRKRFIDPCKTGGVVLRDAKTGARRIFIPATAEDNQHLLEANPKYFDKLQGITSEAERRAMILGDWYTFEGQVFNEFRMEPLQDEPENARHVIPPFDIPNWWPKLISIDWGFNAWCYIIWAALSPDNRVYIYRKYAVKGAKIRQWTRDLNSLTGAEMDNVRDIRICWSAMQDRGMDQTIFEQVSDALSEAGFKCTLTLGDKNRVAGKQLVHEYLRWNPLSSVKNIVGQYDPSLARKIERMYGTQAVKDYANFFTPEETERNLPKLQLFDVPTVSDSPKDEVPELADCIQTCVYDEDKIEDVKEFSGDDPYDCLRILLNAVRDYFGEASNEYVKQQKIGLAGNYLAQTGDQTGYYRRCEAAEISEKEVFSVRRQVSRFGGMSRMRGKARGFRH